MIIGVRLAVWHRFVVSPHSSPSGFNVAQVKLVTHRVVALGFGKSHSISRIISETHPKAISLYLLITLAFLTRPARHDARQQATRWIALLHVSVHPIHELVASCPTRLYSVQCLTVFRIRLAADMVGHTRHGHEVSLVGGIHKNRPLKTPTRLHCD